MSKPKEERPSFVELVGELLHKSKMTLMADLNVINTFYTHHTVHKQYTFGDTRNQTHKSISHSKIDKFIQTKYNIGNI